MPAPALVVAIALLIASVLVYAASSRPARPPDSIPVADLLARENPHRKPDAPYAVPEAHDVWQEHMHCDRRDCGAKSTALAVLVEAHKVVPGR